MAPGARDSSSDSSGSDSETEKKKIQGQKTRAKLRRGECFEVAAGCKCAFCKRGHKSKDTIAFLLFFFSYSN